MPKRKMLPKGTLVRLKEDYPPVGKDSAQMFGHLHIIEAINRETETYMCKSIATGQVLLWFPNEIEEAPITEDKESDQ